MGCEVVQVILLVQISSNNELVSLVDRDTVGPKGSFCSRDPVVELFANALCTDEVNRNLRGKVHVVEGDLWTRSFSQGGQCK